MKDWNCRFYQERCFSRLYLFLTVNAMRRDS
jgi:hypothetical protein